MPVFRAGKRLATAAVFPRPSQGSNRAMTPDEPRRGEISEKEFVRRMPEGEGAGPGAPETEEPVQGRPGAGGHGPTDGPGGAAMEGMDEGRTDEARDGADGAGEDRGGTAAGEIKKGVEEAGRIAKEAAREG